jgi:hypothetical protein
MALDFVLRKRVSHRWIVDQSNTLTSCRDSLRARVRLRHQHAAATSAAAKRCHWTAIRKQMNNQLDV